MAYYFETPSHTFSEYLLVLVVPCKCLFLTYNKNIFTFIKII